MIARLAFALLVIVAVGCRGAKAKTEPTTKTGEPAADRRGFRPITEAEIQAAEFSSTDPYITMLWVARHFRPVLEVQFDGNDLAEKKARDDFQRAMGFATGRRITWPALVEKITTHNTLKGNVSYLGVQKIGLPFVPDGVLEKDLDLAGDLFPVYTLEISTGILVKDERWGASARRGMSVQISGTVKSINAANGGEVRLKDETRSPRFIRACGVSLFEGATLTPQ